MNIVGKDPSGTVGESMNLNIITSMALQVLCEQVIVKGHLPFSTLKWEYCRGAGLTSQKKCNLLANALEKLLPNLPETYHINFCSEATFEHSPDALRGAEVPNQKESQYSITKKQIEQFIAFLRHCGGFKIY